MDLFDSIGDFVGGIADGVSDVFSSGWDWIGNNAGDIFEIGGMAVDAYSSEKQAEAAEDLAKLQAQEISRVAKANAELFMHDAEAEEEKAQKIRVASDYAYWQNNRTVDRVISSQTAAYGKAGVAASSGTPLSVALATKQEGDRQGNMVLYNGRTEAEAVRNTADRYRYSAGQTLETAARQINILEEAMEDELTAMEYSQWSKGINDLFRIGFRNDWWS